MEIDKQRIAELVVKIQNGDNSAFDELYKLTSERAYFVALEFTKNNQDSEDILQESYIKALSKINELDKPESFSSWLNQIVANKSKDFLKKKKPILFEAEENEVFEVLPDEDTNFSPEENLDQTELQKTVMEVLDELSEEKRACVLMMYFEELSVGEIAETLEIPEGTVKTRLFSARKDLKDKFAKRGITSTFSFAPIGVVIWALRRMSDTVSKTFVGSGTSAKVLAGITVAGTSTAAGVAVAGTAAATTAAATGTGVAAKIAALSVAQKVVAGVSVAAVVAGGTVGVVTVVNDDKKDDISTTAYIEEYTTAPSYETTLAIEVLGSVEFSETTDLSSRKTSEISSSTAKQSTAKLQSTSNNKTTANPTKTTTKPATQTTSNKSTTSQKQTTATTQNRTTTKKPATTKITTTKPTTTKRVTTTEPETEEVVRTTKEQTTVVTTLANPVIQITYNIAGSSGNKQYTYSVSPGTEITDDLIYDIMINKSGFGFIEASVQSGDYSSSAEPGETYNFYVVCIEG